MNKELKKIVKRLELHKCIASCYTLDVEEYDLIYIEKGEVLDVFAYNLETNTVELIWNYDTVVDLPRDQFEKCFEKTNRRY